MLNLFRQLPLQGHRLLALPLLPCRALWHLWMEWIPTIRTRRNTPFLVRWSRFALRTLKKFEWHAKGILLWLVQRSCLRYVPFPYPSVSTCEAWKEQANKMAFEIGCLSHRHLERAAILNSFNAANLADCIWLRNRVGLKVAFMEDPLLEGMLAAKSAKGTAALLKKEAFAEAQRQARVLASQDKLQSAARELLGPKGGLPTLKKDLIKLAAYLEQPIDEKATVDQMKSLLRPLVSQLFIEKPNPSSTASSSKQPIKERPSPKQPLKTEGPYLPLPAGQGIGREAYLRHLESRRQEAQGHLLVGLFPWPFQWMCNQS